MQSVAVAIICKTPAAGLSKTRLSPPLRHEECAALSACFIRDLSATIDGVSAGCHVTPYAVYTPAGTEEMLRTLLPRSFRLLLQSDGDLGARLARATTDLLRNGHAAAILVNADSPTLPASILTDAVGSIRGQDAVVLSPALDGGYALIGLSRPHTRLFKDIPWSTPHVYRQTIQRAEEMDLPVIGVPGWYDVDDIETLRLLELELAGEPLPRSLSNTQGAPAPATRRFFERRRAQPREAAP